MVKCKCGVWTDYGLTCSSCAQDMFMYDGDDSYDEYEEALNRDDDDSNSTPSITKEVDSPEWAEDQQKEEE